MNQDISGVTQNVQQSSVSQQSQDVNQSNVIICSRCGSPMKKEARYCMKCGQLNYAHPDNESMKQYAWQSIKEGNYISANNLNNAQPLSLDRANVSNPFRTCLIVNLVFNALLILLMVLPFLIIGAKITAGYIIIFTLVGVINFIMTYSMQAIYIKADEPWWGYFVPFYGNYLVYKIAFGNGWLFLTLLIPVVGSIILLMMTYNLGKKFYKSGWLTLLFPFIMIPIIGLDKNSEYSLLARTENNTSVSVDVSKKTESEKSYAMKKTVTTLIILIILIIVIYFTWPYLNLIIRKLYNLIMESIKSFK